MPKYLPFSRRELRSRFATWAKKNWRTIGIFGVGLLLLLALETYLLLGLGERTAWKWYVLGIVHAGVIAAFLYALGATFIAHDREAIFHLRGAWGEENTRDELKRAKRKKVIWDWVDSVTLASGDIDHLVVTRAGGLVALDSKWRNQVGANDRDAMVKSAHRVVKLRAEGVMQSLLRRERGGHRAAVNPLRVRPAVVVWGAWKEDVPSGAQLEGVDFVGGRELVSWLRYPRRRDGHVRRGEGSDPADRSLPRRGMALTRGVRGDVTHGACRCAFLERERACTGGWAVVTAHFAMAAIGSSVGESSAPKRLGRGLRQEQPSR